MKRSKVKVLKKRIRNLIIIGIILFAVIMAYKVQPLSKSEKIVTTNITYVDSSSQEQLNFTINTDSYDDNGYYFELPSNINGLQVSKYYLGNINNETDDESNMEDVENITDSDETNIETNESDIDSDETNIETDESDIDSDEKNIDVNESNMESNKNNIETFLLPGTKYYFTDEEINSEKVMLNVIYNTKETNEQQLYYKVLETNLDQNVVKVEGYMPKDSNISIKVADFKEVENKIKETDDTLSLNVAYDIKILSNDEKYEPTDFDENIKITILRNCR